MRGLWDTIMLMNTKMAHMSAGSDLKRLGTILFVGAHPDDETFCAGATLAAAVRNGQRVICVTATHGEKGVQDASKWPTEKLGQIREAELKHALGELGISEHYFLDYRDGECQEASQEEAARRLTDVIERCLVDTVFTFGSDGLTGHPDHQTVSRWVDAAVHASTREPRVYHIAQWRPSYEKYLKAADKDLHIFFKTTRPPLVDKNSCAICLSPEAKSIEQKYRALKAMPSQTSRMLEVISPSNFVGALGYEAFVEVIRGRTRKT